MPMAIPLAVGAGAAGVGAIGQAIAGGQAADAAGKISQAQLDAAKQYAGQAQAVAMPTAQELGVMHQQLGQAGAALQRQAQLFASVDPALLESGKQALALLQGKSAAAVDPMLQQRAQQRQQLQQQLVQQYGPGGAMSSAGAQALANFDLQTANYQAGLQQQMLGTLLGETNFAAGQGIESGGQAAGLFGNVMGQASAIQNRQTGAALSAGGMVVGQAGAPFAGQLASAQNMGNMFGSIGKFGGQVAGMGALGMGMAGNPAAQGVPGAPSGGYGVGGTTFTPGRAPMGPNVTG